MGISGFLLPRIRRRPIVFGAGAIFVAGAMIAPLAGCRNGAAGTVPSDVDRGTSVPFEGSPPDPIGDGQSSQHSPTAGSTSESPGRNRDGDVFVTGKTNLGGKASPAFVAKIREAVTAYVTGNMPGTTVVDVRIATEQSQYAFAVVTLAGAGGVRSVTATLAEQPTGWVVGGMPESRGGGP